METTFQNIITRYKALTPKQQMISALAVFILGIVVLSNIIVYAVSAVASYKLIDKKLWRYTAVSLLSVATFFSGVLWLGETFPATDSADAQKTVQTTVAPNETPAVETQTGTSTTVAGSSENLYEVVRVVDGDTIDVSIDGKTERIRLIGINTPETVDPRKPVECFGVEASNKAKELLTGKKVSLESDSTQGERDKYDRLLRYAFIDGDINFNLLMIQTGFAYEYTYDLPYKYQSEFKEAQQKATASKAGLWGDACQNQTETTQPCTTIVVPAPVTVSPVSDANPCTIKGNINSEGEKIFHVVGCGSYNQTKIDEGRGERWFCSEQEARDAGWRKAMNCN